MTYDVYAVGNALVDFEFRVGESFLSELALDKGHMTLIDETRERSLLEVLSEHDRNMACGGSAANTVIAVSQFGGRSFYSCKVADDSVGDFFYRDLVAEGVETNVGKQREPGVTGKCLVFITPDAERTMTTHLGITQELSTVELNAEAIAASKTVYIEGYLVASETARQAAIEARQRAQQAKVPTALTFSDPNMVRFFRDGLSEILGDGVDLLFCNEEEALTFCETDRLEIARERLKEVARTFAITLGSKGSLIWDGREFIQVLGQRVNAVDTVGAGDMYAGAFLYGLTHELGYKGAAELATMASAKLVSSYGPRLPKAETQAVLAQFKPY